MSDNRRKILDNMKLEVSEESETDPEMTNSSLYYKIKVLEEAYAELNSRFSEEYFDEVKNQAKLETFPVGSIYTSTTSTNPSSYIGGTWEAYGSGRTLVGTGSNGTTNYSLGATGGSESHNHAGTVGATALTSSQIPSHNHPIPSLSGTTNEAGLHQHVVNGSTATSASHIHNQGVTVSWGNSTIVSGQISAPIGANGAHSHSVTVSASTTGTNTGGASHSHSISTSSNMQPYIVVYFWRRVS